MSVAHRSRTSNTCKPSLFNIYIYMYIRNEQHHLLEILLLEYYHCVVQVFLFCKLGNCCCHNCKLSGLKRNRTCVKKHDAALIV